MRQYMGVQIDEARDKLLSEQANKLLKDYYCQEGETSPQQAFATIADGALLLDERGEIVIHHHSNS